MKKLPEHFKRVMNSRMTCPECVGTGGVVYEAVMRCYDIFCPVCDGDGDIDLLSLFEDGWADTDELIELLKQDRAKGR